MIRFVLLAAVATFANADDRAPAASLSWTRLPGAEHCIDAPGLARAVEARIGEVLVTPAHADRSVEGRIGPRPGGGWRAVIAIGRANRPLTNTRTIETVEADCRGLDDALTLVVALLVDPSGTPPPPPLPPPVREVRVAVHEPWHLALASRAEVEAGVLEGAAWAGTLALVVDAPRLPQIELAGTYAPARAIATDLPGREVRETFASGAISVCPAIPLGEVRIAACGGVRLGRLAWRGRGFEEDLAGSTLVTALGIDTRVERVLAGPIAMYAVLGARLALRDVTLRYARSAAAGGGMVEVADTERGSVWLGLGLIVRAL